MSAILAALAAIQLAAWLWLLIAHDRFWRSVPELPKLAHTSCSHLGAPAAVDIIVPARNEAENIAATIGSLLRQEYGGKTRILLVDDRSHDATLAIARGIAASAPQDRLAIIQGRPAPQGWSGKLWALEQGIAAAALDTPAPWLLLTDADIVHAQDHLASLMAKANKDALDLVSEMAVLRCESLAERALVPAFVYFFQLLYPFSAVNNPGRRIAAAAGGVILIRRTSLMAAGGLAAIRGALIDDVALAGIVKPVGRIWLGHSRLASSRRAYPSFADIWRMISRTAFVQLRYSVLALVATVFGMALLFFIPPLLAIFGSGFVRWAGLVGWVLSIALYWPSLGRYRRSPLWALALPLIAGFYLAASVGSAVDHWLGRGQVWKGRAYHGAEP